MSTTKLSERIQVLMDNSMYGNWAADLVSSARALEERVAELERGMNAWCKRAHEFRDSTDAANARAEAAEAKLARVRAEAEAGIDFEDAWGLQERLLTILDSEGSDSHE